MCGIAALLACPRIPPLPNWSFWRGTNPDITTNLSGPAIDNLLPILQRRGPDRTDVQTFHLDASTKLQTFSTLLSLRPPSQTPEDGENQILLFNGELYDIPSQTSDTQHLQTLLASLPPDGPLTPTSFDSLRGPWTIILWRPVEQRLYFARDTLGRRSLLMSITPGLLALSSVAHGPSFCEIPPAGVCYFDVSSASFGMYERPSRIVLPIRLANQSTAETEIRTYTSFLPVSWLRSIHGRSPIEITAEQSVTQFLTLFRQSMKRRLATRLQFHPSKPRYATLFSGGVDSLLIAAVLNELLPEGEPLHLINVAFGHDREAIAACPDRMTAIQGITELRALSSSRQIVLICVDVGPDQADQVLAKHVRSLVHPCDQPMDASIGTALWMAAQGRGYVHPIGTDNLLTEAEITSSAKILFSGLGADELMGGYKGRHRTTYRRYGVRGIAREMDADLSRLWFRNLGRDDRIIGDHGKEVRHPFLDEDLIAFVTSLPLVEHVCDLSQADGVGDKQLLRRALRRVGFGDEVARRGKRAIQFGSRSKQVIERKRIG